MNDESALELFSASKVLCIRPVSWLLYFFFLPVALCGAPKSNSFGTTFSGQSAAPMIVLDAGHGGRDQGAKGKMPFCEEKRISLQTAKLVKKYLDHLGYRVVMTRSTDAFLSLQSRVEIAQQAQAQAFVSIHFNASRNPAAKGIEVFFYDSKEDKIRSRSSKLLADLVLPRLIRRTSAPSRGVKKGNFYVIRETTMPAILVEGGFISNPKERAQLKDPEYQEKMARAIADGLDAYFKKTSRHVTKFFGQFRPRRELNLRPVA